MHALHFSPVSNELFLLNGPTAEEAAAPALFARLRALGWPARARLCSAKAPKPAQAVAGVLIELIDALPLLAQTTSFEADGAALSWVPTLAAWQAAARLALNLTCRGRLSIHLGQQGSGVDARWQVVQKTPDERAALLRVLTDFSAVVAIPEESMRPSGKALAERAPLSAPRLLQRFLDACADTLVREASRRGALVRLKACPATSFEQRLVRALGEDRARFYCEAQEAAALCEEINAWAHEQAGADSQSFWQFLGPAPARWQAAESLASVLRRLMLPAGRLAETLLGGQAAPRTLRPYLGQRLAA